MSEDTPTHAVPGCDAEWAPGVPCPHGVAEIPKPFRMRGYRPRPRCYLHRGDNVTSKVLHLLTDKGSAVLALCPHGCHDESCHTPRSRQAYCRYEVEAAVEVIELAAAQLLALSRDLAPQQFRLLADLATARVILRRIENHLARAGVVEEVVVQIEKVDDDDHVTTTRTTSGRLSSFLQGRERLLRIVRQHELDLGLYDPVPVESP